MMQSTSLDILYTLEKNTGPLSKAQRALLITDGSVTRLLEVFDGAPIGVKTINQKIVSATEEIAEKLDILPGNEVNFREVILFNKTNLKPLIQAISYAPLSHLPHGAITRLMREDEPIGYIMRDEKMESRRELLSISNILSSNLDPGIMNGLGKMNTFKKTYRIIHKNHPIFLIDEYIPENLFSDTKSVRIKTPSRLHIGLLDMNGSLGRIDGGAGITLEKPGFEIEIKEADDFSLTAGDPSLAITMHSILERMKANGLNIPPVHIHVHDSIPFHSGLGSGTQAALGLTAGISSLLRLSCTEEELIAFTGRGGTSGIGSRSFFHGGFLVDAGHSFGPGKRKNTYAPSSASGGAGVAPLIGRYDVPQDWEFVLAIPDKSKSVSGQDEQSFFQQSCPVSLEDVRTLSHILLMQMIPSVIEQDIDAFGKSINAFQDLGFKRYEILHQPLVITDVIESMRNAGASGVGMSSFGPVIYAVTDSNSADIMNAAQELMNDHEGGVTLRTKGRNTGAEIITNNDYGA